MTRHGPITLLCVALAGCGNDSEDRGRAAGDEARKPPAAASEGASAASQDETKPSPGPFVQSACDSPSGVSVDRGHDVPPHADIRKASASVKGEQMQFSLEVAGHFPDNLGKVHYSLGFHTRAKPKPQIPLIGIQGNYEVVFRNYLEKTPLDVKPEIEGAALTVTVPLDLFEPGTRINSWSSFDATSFFGGGNVDSCTASGDQFKGR